MSHSPLVTLSLTALPAFPLVEAGDDLAALILSSLSAASLSLTTGDVLVIAQKVVSKAEGRRVALKGVVPSERAMTLAREAGKDPRVVELVLSEASEVMRVRPGVIIVRHRLGLVLANAGIDQSNVAPMGDEQVLLLPLDPDHSCREIQDRLRAATGLDVAVLIIDSIGRAWRTGTVGTAIGVAGLPGLVDLRGQADLYGRPLMTSELGLADEVASAASLLMGQAAEGRPVVLVRGLPYDRRPAEAAELLRPQSLDLFN